MSRIENSMFGRARRRVSLRTKLPLAVVVLLTMLLPSLVSAEPLVNSPADVMVAANGDLDVYPSNTSCLDDGTVDSQDYQAIMGSGSDYSGLILGLDLYASLSTEGAAYPFTLCGAVKPAAGKSSADCREFAATLRGTRVMYHLIANEYIVDLFEAEMTAFALGYPQAAVSLTGTYTRYREDGTATGETGELHLLGRADSLGQHICHQLGPNGGWSKLFWSSQGYELSETPG